VVREHIYYDRIIVPRQALRGRRTDPSDNGKD
jgi:hypothetical protein